MSVLQTKAPSSATAAATSKGNQATEHYVKVHDRLEDVDQQRVTLQSNRDLHPPGTAIHTGQAYDADDYRNIRFVNKGKLVGVTIGLKDSTMTVRCR
jgi:hypothetical protein